MKEKLIFINYQRVIPPFIQTEIQIAKDIFSEIIYITPQLKYENNGKEYINFNNVKIIEISNFKWYMGFFRLSYMLFRKEVMSDILNCIKEKRFNKNFIFEYTKKLNASENFRKISKKIVSDNQSKYVLLAAWFSAEAYAIAKLKEKYPKIKAMSFAHSFEVDPDKNNYIDYNCNKILHNNLDNINFISKSVYDVYKKIVMNKYDIKDYNITFRYLGCKKLYNVMNEKSNDNVFRIVSCSGVTPVKRLDLILKSLSTWDYCTLEWTHLGDGPLMEEIISQANEIKAKNKNIRINLKGHCSNQEVHKYYSENKCDLFINVSYSEGLPVSLMECMAYGIPAIATDVGGSREIVTEDTGILIDKNISSEHLKEIIADYWMKSELEKDMLRKNSYQKWKNEFQVDINSRRYLRRALLGNE